MSQPLFRKESLDHISSPEELHNYMRVTSPRLWMLLSVILALLIGFVVYASTTVMENTMKVTFDVDTLTMDGQSVTSVFLELPLSQKDNVAAGMAVRLAGQTGKISIISQDSESLFLVVDMDNRSFTMPDGKYEGEIVTESVTPLGFLLN